MAKLKEAEEIIGYRFNNPALLEGVALIRHSFNIGPGPPTG